MLHLNMECVFVEKQHHMQHSLTIVQLVKQNISSFSGANLFKVYKHS